MACVGWNPFIRTSSCPTGPRRSTSTLRDRADSQGLCWPALGTIARELSLSRSTVKRAVQDLKAAGYLETQQRWRQNGGKSSLQFRLLK